MKTLKITYADGSTCMMNESSAYGLPINDEVTKVELIEEQTDNYALEAFKKSGWCTPVNYYPIEKITIEFLKGLFANGYWQIKITKPNIL
jgi:hypothetical protein